MSVRLMWVRAGRVPGTCIILWEHIPLAPHTPQEVFPGAGPSYFCILQLDVRAAL